MTNPLPKEPPFSLPVNVVNLRPDGVEIIIAPDAFQLKAIAELLDLASLESFTGRVRLEPRQKGHVHASGEIRGALHQTCIVTLDAFPVAVTAPINVEFAPSQGESDARPIRSSKPLEIVADSAPAIHDLDEVDPPDLIVNGQIDVGVLATEFLTLSLDPFPRKPGAVFEFSDAVDEKENPFAALARLKAPE